MKAFFITIAVIALVAVFIIPSCQEGKMGLLSPPLSIKYRASYIGKGYVLVITNETTSPIYDIRVKLGNTDAESNNVSRELDPSQSVELGWMQIKHGDLHAGEYVYIYARGYLAPITSEAP